MADKMEIYWHVLNIIPRVSLTTVLEPTDTHVELMKQ